MSADLNLSADLSGDNTGCHLMLDCWNCENVGDPSALEAALREAVTLSGRELHDIQFRATPEVAGFSGFAVLDGAHFNFYSWPGNAYAIFDFFQIGSDLPHGAAEIIRKAFSPNRTKTKVIYRGRG